MESNSINLDKNIIKTKQNEIHKVILAAKIYGFDFYDLHKVNVLQVYLHNDNPKIHFTVKIRYNISFYSIDFSKAKGQFGMLTEYVYQSKIFLFLGGSKISIPKTTINRVCKVLSSFDKSF